MINLNVSYRVMDNLNLFKQYKCILLGVMVYFLYGLSILFWKFYLAEYTFYIACINNIATQLGLRVKA